MLRTSLLSAAVLSVLGGLSAYAQGPTTQLAAAPSTRATAIVNLTPPRGVEGVAAQRIRIDYGQPHLRGRSLHTGNLVPLDSVWRLGANEATELETGVDLTIGGHLVPKGKYTLYALPTAGGWKLIVNKNTGQWGTDYKVEHDLVRIDLRRRTLAAPIESLSIWLIPSTMTPAQLGTPPSGDLRIAWGTTELSTTWAMRP
jgi:hypothetical protein